jgi:hypothetical protein
MILADSLAFSFMKRIFLNVIDTVTVSGTVRGIIFDEYEGEYDSIGNFAAYF